MDTRISWKGEEYDDDDDGYDAKGSSSRDKGKEGNGRGDRGCAAGRGAVAMADGSFVRPRGILATIGHGFKYFWVTRDTVQTGDSAVKIKTTLRELIIYIVFLVILCVMTFGMMSSSMFYYNSLVSNLFLTTPTQPQGGVNFQGIGSMDDFWAVVQGPLLSGLYQETWYNGRNLSEDDLGFVLNENKLLGVPQMRQLRVRNNSCVVPDDFADIIRTCYDSYTDAVADQKPFGLMNGSAWTYEKSSLLGGTGYWGKVSSYGSDGYSQPLFRTLDESMAALQELFDHLWIDRGTRAVFIDFTLYNGNINLFCVVRLVTEFPPTGGVIPSWSIQTVKLLRYVSPSDYFVLSCEIFFVLFIIYYIIEEVIEIRLRRLAYFKVFWNILDVVVILVGILCVAFDFYRTVAVGRVLDGLLRTPDAFPDFTFLAYWQATFNAVLAVMVFCCWVKIFKYISFNKTMTQLSSTLSKCAKDLGGFAVMFFIIFLAFAQLGYLLFGSQLEAYSSFDSSIFTLYRLILGDFDFAGMQQANRVLGPMFFILYVFFVFFILLNMFLAIINDTYSEVKSDLSEQANEFELGEYFRKGAMKMMEKLNIKKEKILDIQEAMKGGDLNNDGVIDFDEWRQTMKTRGYADAEIEAVFAKYDTDGDRGLNVGEQGQMEKDLADQKINVDDELQQIRETEGRGDEEEEGDAGGGVFGGGGGRRKSSMRFDHVTQLQTRVDRLEESLCGVMMKLNSVMTQLSSSGRDKPANARDASRPQDLLTISDNFDTHRSVSTENVREGSYGPMNASRFNAPFNKSSSSSRPVSGQE